MMSELTEDAFMISKFIEKSIRNLILASLVVLCFAYVLNSFGKESNSFIALENLLIISYLACL